jgi:ATP-binding cassette, subfamily B, bacterial
MKALASVRYMLGLVWRADRGCVSLSFYKQCSEDLFLSFFVVYFSKTLYTWIGQGIAFGSIVTLVAIFCGIHVLIHVTSAFYAYYIRLKAPEVNRRMFAEVMDKAKRIELRKYEQPDFYNDFARALDNCQERTMAGLESASVCAGALVSVAASMAIVSTIDPVLIAFLVPPVVASLWLGGKRNALQFEMGNAETPFRRMTDYAKRVFFEKKYSGEVRLYGIKELLISRHREGIDRRYGIAVSYGRRIFAVAAAQVLFMFCLMSASISLYIAWAIKVQGVQAVGAYVAVLTTAGFITYKAADAMRRAVEAGNHSVFMNNYRDFLEAEEEARDSGRQRVQVPEGERLGDIEFENLRFCYEGSQRPVLDSLSLKVRKGEKIALIGENGAGKTTLVKLLMGLYQPTGGRVLVNGRDLRDWERDSYRARVGAVFQDLQVFGLSLAENVLLRAPEGEGDLRLAEEALRLAQCGEVRASLPRGLDTPITKEFDEEGFVCSGGQAQKIAIARIFAKRPDIVILDEPSSALDPIAEFRMYQNMMQASEGRTVFFISHRLSSARLADRIAYMEGGRVAETGTHEELMASGGRYRELFLTQARSYREESWETVEGNELYGKQ